MFIFDYTISLAMIKKTYDENYYKYQHNTVKSTNLWKQRFVLPSPRFKLMLLRYRNNTDRIMSSALGHSTT